MSKRSWNGSKETPSPYRAGAPIDADRAFARLLASAVIQQAVTDAFHEDASATVNDQIDALCFLTNADRLRDWCELMDGVRAEVLIAGVRQRLRSNTGA